jgi:hypothetical protein
MWCYEILLHLIDYVNLLQFTVHIGVDPLSFCTCSVGSSLVSINRLETYKTRK